MGRTDLLRFLPAGAECWRPNGAVFHAYVHIKTRAVNGQVIESIARDAEILRRLPPAEPASRLRNEGMHTAVGKIVNPW